MTWGEWVVSDSPSGKSVRSLIVNLNWTIAAPPYPAHSVSNSDPFSIIMAAGESLITLIPVGSAISAGLAFGLLYPIGPGTWQLPIVNPTNGAIPAADGFSFQAFILGG